MEMVELLQRIRQGDQQAFETFYQKTYQMVYFHVRKYLKDEEDVQEVVQDVYLSVFQGVDKLQDVNVWKSWLGGIVHHLAIKKATRGRHSDVSLDEEIAESILPADFSAEPGSQLDQKETQRLVGEMIDNLPTAQKVTLTLYYFDELKTAEIAQIMECSEGTVKSRLNYARKSIEKQTVELEKKQGVRLYSLTPALLLAALRWQWEGTSAAIPAMGAAIPSVAKAAAVSSTAGTSAGAATTAAAGAAGTAAKAVGAKIIAGILVATIVIGGGGYAVHRMTAAEIPEAPAQTGAVQPTDQLPEETGEVSSTPALPDYYAAYLEVVNDYIAQYGDSAVQQAPSSSDAITMTSVTGVGIVRLIDFDMDGTEELFLIYSLDSTLYHSYGYAIWTSTDGKTAEKLCENAIFDGAQSYGPMLKLVTKPDGVYIYEHLDDPDGEYHVYRKVTAAGISDALTLRWIPPYLADSGDGTYVNGTPVSYDEYVKAEEDFLDDAETTQIDLTSWSRAEFFETADKEHAFFRTLVHKTQDVIALLRGETVDAYHYQSQTNETYPSYKEVVSTFLAEYGEPAISSSSRYLSDNGMPAMTGLCVVRLVDLNNDGTDELLLIYTEKLPVSGKDAPLRYGHSVWATQNGQAVKLHSGLLPGTALEPCYGLLKGTEQTYFYLSYDTNSGTVDRVADLEYYSEYYKFDGTRLSSLKYENIQDEDVWDHDETEYFYLTAWSYRFRMDIDWDEDSRSSLEQTQNTIQALRELN